MKKSAISLFCLLLMGTLFAQQKESKGKQAFTTAGKKVTVYTTAANTNLRLSPTAHFGFCKSSATARNRNIHFCRAPTKIPILDGNWWRHNGC